MAQPFNKDFLLVAPETWEVEVNGQTLTVEKIGEDDRYGDEFLLSFDGERFTTVEGSFDDLCDALGIIEEVMETNE